MNEVKDELAPQDSVTASGKVGDTPVGETDLIVLAIREREQGERRAEAILAAAAREAVDPEWGPTTRQEIVERFASKAPAGHTLISATCKTTLCIAEIEILSSEESSAPPVWSALFGLPRGFVLSRDPDSGGVYRSVVFLARHGHPLPEVN